MIWAASSAALTPPLTATVAVNGAANAALLCLQMLAIEDAELAAALDAKRVSDHDKVMEKNAAIEKEFNQ